MNVDTKDISTILAILADSPLGLFFITIMAIMAFVIFGLSAYIFLYRKLKVNSDLSVKTSQVDMSILDRLYHELDRKDRIIKNLREELETTRNALNVANSDKSLLISNLEIAQRKLDLKRNVDIPN